MTPVQSLAVHELILRMEAAGCNSSQVAASLGVTRQAVEHWTRCGQRPSWDTMIKLRDVWHIRLDWWDMPATQP